MLHSNRVIKGGGDSEAKGKQIIGAEGLKIDQLTNLRNVVKK